jgi:hypothetical protein
MHEIIETVLTPEHSDSLVPWLHKPLTLTLHHPRVQRNDTSLRWPWVGFVCEKVRGGVCSFRLTPFAARLLPLPGRSAPGEHI